MAYTKFHFVFFFTSILQRAIILQVEIMRKNTHLLFCYESIHKFQDDILFLFFNVGGIMKNFTVLSSAKIAHTMPRIVLSINKGERGRKAYDFVSK